ncbi:enoyl-CoA hydratase-related protein [Frankia sp. CiP3]|uniref:enoyl-CoA hydratase-related protein n=1 Tax=Frankia sp. CiP3 TaxID=2880971 RepID=UPI001EF593D6|nr:enoyl-CoA hydratase-related protein [Frankia sp. CiP3]
MSRPAAVDLAAAGVTLAIDGSRATVTIDRQDHDAGWARAASTAGALADIGRCLAGNIRLVLLRIIGGLPCPDHGRVDSAAADGVERPGMAGMAGVGVAGVGSRPAAQCWLSRPDLFSVAVVSGYAVDALHLALACDLRVFCEDAYLAMTGIHQGLVPALGVSHTLVDLIGYSRALDLCVTGRMLSGRQAYELGLAERLAAPGDRDDTVEELVTGLLAAPRGLAVEIKALLLHSRERTRTDQLRAERDAWLRTAREAASAG